MNSVFNRGFVLQVEAECEAVHAGREVWDMDTRQPMHVIEA